MLDAATSPNSILQYFFDFSRYDVGAGKVLNDTAHEISRNLARTFTWTADLSCEEARSRIELARRLGKGWNSYSADPPSPEALHLAKKFVEIVRQNFFAPPHVLASAEGGISTAFAVHNRFAQIEFLNSGSVISTIFSTELTPLVQAIDPSVESLKDALETIRNFITG